MSTSSSTTSSASPTQPDIFATTGNGPIPTLVAALRTLVPSSVQTDPSGACFLQTSVCQATPSWWSSVPTDAKSYYSSAYSANIATCTSCPLGLSGTIIKEQSSNLSTGAKAGISSRLHRRGRSDSCSSRTCPESRPLLCTPWRRCWRCRGIDWRCGCGCGCWRWCRSWERRGLEYRGTGTGGPVCDVESSRGICCPAAGSSGSNDGPDCGSGIAGTDNAGGYGQSSYRHGNTGTNNVISDV